MAFSTTTVKTQIGAANPQFESARADKSVATLTYNNLRGGWSEKDTDELVRAPQLRDRAVTPGARRWSKAEAAALRPLYVKADDMRQNVSMEVTGKKERAVDFTSTKSRDYFLQQMGRFHATDGAPGSSSKPSRPSSNAGQTAPSAPAAPTAPTAPVAPSIPAGAKTLDDIRSANKAIVALLAKATTLEPASNSETRWTRQMREVVTFASEGGQPGSLERTMSANGISDSIVQVLLQAARYGAHRNQSTSNGVLAFVPTAANLAKLEKDLNGIYERRAGDKGYLTRDEIASARSDSSNADALLTGTRMQRINDIDTSANFRSEAAFASKVAYAMELLYDGGRRSINGPRDVERRASAQEAQGNQAEATAIRTTYAAVSRYLSRGRTAERGFICTDQRQDVHRALMRTFGGDLDRTERSIDALNPPA
ncbi:MAG: hypothetical protein RMA76_32205 [Deltaproteobacteria bacterium]|jgi:hypothetical protein